MRASGRALDVVLGQVRESLPDELAGVAFTVAYEPVWAIGTGVTPTTGQIEEVHGAIRQALSERWSVGLWRAASSAGVSKFGGSAAIVLGAEASCGQ